MPKRKRGGQPGNTNAVKDGWHTAAAKAARWQAWQELQAACREQAEPRLEPKGRLPTGNGSARKK